MTPVKIKSTYYCFWTCVPGYCAKHPSPVQHKTCLHTGDKREAKARIDALEKQLSGQRARVALGLPAELGGSDMPLREYQAAYLESTQHDKAESTRRTEGYHLATLLSTLGDARPLSSLSQDVLEEYKRRRLAQIAPRSWNSELATLKSIFAWGTRRHPKLYDRNPFDSISRVDKGQPTIQKYITRADLAKAIQACKEPYWINVLAFLYATWCRGSELRELRWGEVYQGHIKFVGPKEARDKTKTIPRTPVLNKILARAWALHPDPSGFPDPTSYVFPNPEDWRTPMTKDVLHHKLADIGKRAGVKLSPHMLRHSGITDALAAGAPLFSVQSVAGHTQVSTTQGYAHVDMDAQQKAMQVLDMDGILGTTYLLPPDDKPAESLPPD